MSSTLVSPLASTLRVELFGSARVITESRVLHLERRPAALLALLALEGATTRGRLAGLLWPDGDDVRARANLRQLLRRLRASSGADLICGDNTLALSDGLGVDAARLLDRAFAADRAGVLEFTGELLAGFTYDDLPEFEEWLLSVRERLEARRREAAMFESERLEASGDLSGALEFARRRAELEPLSEEAHRRLMALLYRLGDRGAALAVFERLRAALRAELGSEPLPQTLKLLGEIEAAMGVDLTALQPPKSHLPLSVLRPPLLAGRETEWLALEAAWAARQFIFISGQPGAGKSRLALDFAATKGQVTNFSSRPGDATVPYAASARTLRRALEASPDLVLPGWVRSELSRLVPELGETVRPLEGDSARLRFYDAYVEALRLTHPHGGCYVSDDFQFADPAAVELGAYVLPRAFEQGVGTIVAYRSGELSESSARTVEALVAGGALHLELEPLAGPEVSQVLASLGVPGLGAFAAQIARHTGGNPQFVLETVRHLLETGQLESSAPTGNPGLEPDPPRLWPLRGRVLDMTARRLKRLSGPARDLARVAALLGTELTAERAARVLGQGVLALAEPWAELEAAQVLSGEAFSHDLILEATLASVPAVVRRELHRGVAGVLEATGAASAHIAGHWLEAGDPARAAPRFVKAARAAEDAYRLSAAAALQARASSLFESLGQFEAAFDAADEEGRLMARSDVRAERGAVIARLERLASDPGRRARAAVARATWLYTAGRAEEAERAAHAGLADAALAGEARLEANLWASLVASLWARDRLPEALEAQQRAHALELCIGEAERVAESFVNLGVLLDDLERRNEAITHYERGLEHLGPSSDRLKRAGMLNNLAVSQAELGCGQASLETLRRAWALLEDVDGANDLRAQALTALGTRYHELADYRRSLETFAEALALVSSAGLWTLPTVLRARASVYLTLGRADLTHAGLDKALTQPNLRRKQRAAILRVRGRALLLQGDRGAALEAYAEAERVVAAGGESLALWSALLNRASVSPPDQALELSLNALRQAESHGLVGLEIAARTHAADALIALGRASSACEQADRAVERLETHVPTAMDRAEVLLVQARALGMVNPLASLDAFRRAAVWVLETSQSRVPGEYRAGFLRFNPVNRALLQGSGLAGFEGSGLEGSDRSAIER